MAERLPATIRHQGKRALLENETPTTVNEPGLASSADGKREEGIDRSFERTGTPMYLGQYKSSLERGEQSGGQVLRVDAGPEFPVCLKRSQSIGDRGCPVIEPGRDERSGLGVALGELATK